jgi:hypothetical protein
VLQSNRIEWRKDVNEQVNSLDADFDKI